ERRDAAALRRDRGDDPDRQALVLEHRALLDVHLEVAEDVVRSRARPDRVRVAAERPRCVAQDLAEPVREPRILRAEVAGPAAAAEEGQREAAALLVGKGDDLERV